MNTAKKTRLDRVLKVLLWFCGLTAIAGLIVLGLGSDIGVAMVAGAVGIGVFPAFHFASLVAFEQSESDQGTGGD